MLTMTRRNSGKTNMAICTESNAPGQKANSFGKRLRDRRYYQTKRGRRIRNEARRRYEQTLQGWAHKQIRRIRYRCTNRMAKDWLRYGGRGIELRMTADDLIEMVGDGPWSGMQPHRINNDGDYHPRNVVLLTAEQHRAAHNDACPV